MKLSKKKNQELLREIQGVDEPGKWTDAVKGLIPAMIAISVGSLVLSSVSKSMNGKQ